MSTVLERSGRYDAAYDEDGVVLTDAELEAAEKDIADDILMGERVNGRELFDVLDSLFDPEEFAPLLLRLVRGDDTAPIDIRDKLHDLARTYFHGMDVVADRARENRT